MPILVGATGVGKSEVAYHLARRLGAEILSADAFQVYRGLEVGTAQPPEEWRRKIPHHLIGILEPEETWNAVEFARRAEGILRKGSAEGKRFILVGGAGFYLKALVDGPPEGEGSDPGTRDSVREKTLGMGNEDAHAWLRELDPGSAERIHLNDRKRVLRALEKAAAEGGATPEAGYRALGRAAVHFLGLECSRPSLDERLKARTDAMWREGLLREAEFLRSRGLAADHTLWGAIGYAEALAFLEGELTEGEAKERIFRRTRQYAKRQGTWFRRQQEVEWVGLERFSDAEKVAEYLFENYFGS